VPPPHEPDSPDTPDRALPPPSKLSALPEGGTLSIVLWWGVRPVRAVWGELWTGERVDCPVRTLSGLVRHCRRLMRRLSVALGTRARGKRVRLVMLTEDPRRGWDRPQCLTIGDLCGNPGPPQIEPTCGLIRQPSDPPQRVAGRDPLLDRDLGEQGAAVLLLASHQICCTCPIFADAGRFFSELLGLVDVF
jgi:hypothetical protein